MNHFDTLFFRAYTGADQELKEVFHRHPFAIVEDVLLWTFFGLVIPAFLYGQNIFNMRDGMFVWMPYVFMMVIYVILMYKLFDWYVDVWIMTESTIVSMRWKWFSSDILYIPYKKIEGIEIRTRSWWAALLGMSDVVVKLAGSEEFMLSSARHPTDIVTFLQEATKWSHAQTKIDDREPFEILVESLSWVVKGHLAAHGREYITREYIEKLDDTLTKWKPIDLRHRDEKIIIEDWKDRFRRAEEKGDDEKIEHDSHWHGHHK